MGKMRWFLMAGVLLFAVTLATRGWALTVPAGKLTIKFLDWEVVKDPAAECGSTTCPDGDEDSWGIFKVSSILQGSSTVWWDGKDGEEVTGIFYGFDYYQVIPVDNDGDSVADSYRILATGVPDGAYLEVYSDFSPDFDETQGPGVRSGNTYPTVTDGTLLFKAQFVGGIYPSDPEVVLDISQDTTTFPTTGDGAGYAAIVPGVGSMWQTFDTNSFLGGNADLFVQFDFAPHTGGYGWTLDSNDPVSAAAVPEPATLLLLGSGLLGVAGASRRMRRS